MLKPQTNINETALKMQIDRLFAKLDQIDDASSEDYRLVNARLQELYKLREVDSNVNSKKRDSHAAWAAIGANILGIAMIVEHERAAVITSKALGFVKTVFR